MGVKVCPILLGLPYVQLAAWERLCALEFRPCNPNPESGPIKDCADTWNQIYCSHDGPFSMQYVRGDKIQFQTKFRDYYNPDEENPADGWNIFVIARLVTVDGVISEDVADFCSKYFVGWNGVESIQSIEIDTSLPIFDEVECFHVEFESRYLDGETIIIDSTACTEEWCNCFNCKPWPLLESQIKGYDGHGYWHGDMQSLQGVYFTFSPKYRFPLELVQVGAGVSRILTPGGVQHFDSKLIYRVGTLEYVPPYVLNMLILGFITGKTIIFAGEIYETADTEISRSNTGSEMMIFKFELYNYGKKQKRNC